MLPPDDQDPHAPTEADLHAYVDGQLDDAEAARVRLWLDDHPAQARRVEAWRRDNELLRGLLPLDAVPDAQNLPLPWHATRARVPSRWDMSPPLARAAGVLMAVALTLGLGGAGGWLARDRQAMREAAASGAASAAVPAAAWLGLARAAHAVYTPEQRHPVEVTADEHEHLVAWLSRRLGAPLRLPELQAQGWSLMGGRLLPAPVSPPPNLPANPPANPLANPSPGAPVAQFMYEDPQGRRLTLLVQAAAPAPAAQPSAAQPPTAQPPTALPAAAFSFEASGGLSSFYWTEGRFGYALTAALPRAELLALARAVHRQIRP